MVGHPNPRSLSQHHEGRSEKLSLSSAPRTKKAISSNSESRSKVNSQCMEYAPCFPFRSSAFTQSPPDLLCSAYPSISHPPTICNTVGTYVSSDDGKRVPGIWAQNTRLGGCHACETGQSVPGCPIPRVYLTGTFAAVSSTARARGASSETARGGQKNETGAGWWAAQSSGWLPSASSHEPRSPRAVHCLWSWEAFGHVSLAGPVR
jgi:hypothetical protein